MSITLHHGTSFLVTDDAGDVDPGTEQGYFHLDTRFLSRHALRLDGRKAVVLGSFVPRAAEGWTFLTNPGLAEAAASTLGISVHRTLSAGIREEIAVENFGDGPARLALSLELDTDFAYVLTVKKEAGGGSSDWHPAVACEAGGSGRDLLFRLERADVPHATRVSFDQRPAALLPGEARFALHLGRRERFHVAVEVAAAVGGREERPEREAEERAPEQAQRRRLCRQAPRLESDHGVVEAAFRRAVEDMADLRIKAEGGAGGGGDYAVAAGIPWYMDLFGRDSLIASYESIFVDPGLARGTLEALGRLQGKKRDPVSEEAPGKILHEYRKGPLTPAARKMIPSYPYYGTIDATPLWLVVLSEYVRWTGDLDFARRHWDNVLAALEWMRRWGDRDGDGFLEYQRDADVGLDNQGWKDSSDSVRFRDGRVATPPIALVEVQGYAWDARRRTAELARLLREGAEAERLEEEAAALRPRIERAFWMAERDFPAEALDGEKRPVDSLTSNPGHLLWAGALGRERARRVADVLLGKEMWSGYGVRTMGAGEGGYNPVSYHNGSVWPHDNALLLMGLVRSGLHGHARKLAAGLLEALARFDDQRPPELFCGYAASRFGAPVRYPTACSPQAWASGAVLLLVRALVGLEVDAVDRRLALAPTPIPGMTRLRLSGVPIAGVRTEVTVEADGDRATAEIRGLPRGWRRVESLDDEGEGLDAVEA